MINVSYIILKRLFIRFTWFFMFKFLLGAKVKKKITTTVTQTIVKFFVRELAKTNFKKTNVVFDKTI